jgi:hypothetical protein
MLLLVSQTSVQTTGWFYCKPWLAGRQVWHILSLVDHLTLTHPDQGFPGLL